MDDDSAGPVFDREGAMAHVGDDAEVLRAVLEMFIDSAPARLVALDAAVTAGDARALEDAAHGLKGTAATLSLERVRALALGLEESGEAGTVAGARDRLPALEAAVEEAIQALRHELESMT
jgi:HPt (histidine-containing phosphotransfer) domain-containing protein